MNIVRHISLPSDPCSDQQNHGIADMNPPVVVLPGQSLPGEIVAQALLVLQLDAGPLCEQPAHLVV